MRDDTCRYLASTKQVNQPCETGKGVISPIWRRAKHSLLEVVGSQDRGAGGRAIGEGLKSPGTSSLEIWTAGGGGQREGLGCWRSGAWQAFRPEHH